MLPIPNPCGKFGQWLSAGIGAIGGLFDSFPADTKVHVKPAGATAAQAQGGYATTKPIGELKVGDEVLSVAEWLDAGSEPKRDARLQYNRITEVRESHRPQTLVHLTLDTGETIRATAGHAFKTTEGWRDAILVKRGGKLLLKGGGEASESDGSGATVDGKAERVATVTEVRTEQTTVRVFNLEVANAHTFFVGDEGAWAHNAPGLPPSGISDVGGVEIGHNYHGGDHAPPHVHVREDGQRTDAKVGQNGKPIPGSRDLTPKERKAVKENKGKIRSCLKKVMKWHRSNE
jgi:hypothetical protein